MSFHEFSRYLILVIIGAMVLMLLVGVTIEWWSPWFFGLKDKWKNRNKRLCDYSDRYEFCGLISPSVEGLLDWKHCNKIARRADQRVSGYRILFLPGIGTRMAERIENRYYNQAMQRVYKRAIKIISHYEKQAAYYQFDEELCELIETAKTISSHDCLMCEDSKEVWGPATTSCQTIVACDCQKKRQVVLV